MGEENKHTRERTLQKISEPLQKKFLVCLVLVFVQGKTEQRHLGGGGWKTCRTRGEGSTTPVWEGVLREIFLPPLFSTPPWRPLKSALLEFEVKTL